MNEYVEQREKGLWIVGSRVSLDSVVYAFWDGLSPETIATECFPTLSLTQVYGAITYYLAHRQQVDEYLREGESTYQALRVKYNDPEFAQKLKARRQMALNQE